MAIKKFIIRFFVFLLLVVAISYPISFYISTHFHTFNKQSWILKLENNTYDYAIIGSSRATNMIDVNIIDSICNSEGINLGTSGSSYVENYLILNHFLETNTIRKLLLNIDEFSLNAGESVRGYSFHYYEFLPLFSKVQYKKIYKDNMPKWKYYLWDILPISKYIEYNNNFNLSSQDYGLLNQNKGSELRNDKLEMNELAYKKRHTIINTKDVKYLNLILKLCSDKKIEVIFITTPIFSKTKQENSNNAHQYIDSLAKSQHISWYTFNDVFDYTNKIYFKNETHTNIEGSKLYSKALATQLIPQLKK